MNLALRRTAALAASVVMLSASSAHAQDGPEEVAILQDVVVVGRVPGPAWWKVSDADTSVYVLAIPDSAPRGMAWDSKSAERRIAAAHQLILPSQIRASLLQAVPTAIGIFRDARTKTALETTLPPPLRDRFIAAKAAAGDKAQETKYRAGFAAVMLEYRYRRAKGLREGEVLQTLKTLAKRSKVKVVSPGPSFGAAKPAIREAFGEVPTAQEQTCLTQTLNTMETRAASDRRAALDWAGGDVRALLETQKLGRRTACNEGVRTRELLRQMTAQQVAAIEAALKVPGSAVAIVEVDRLVSVGGVLDTLRARGFEVKTPATID